MGRKLVPKVLFTFFREFPRLLGITAAAMLPKQARGTLRKHITKPFKQVAAPPSNRLRHFQSEKSHRIPIDENTNRQATTNDSFENVPQGKQKNSPFAGLLAHMFVGERWIKRKMSSIFSQPGRQGFAEPLAEPVRGLPY